MKKMENTQEGYVPCGKCTLCCQNDAIRLLPEDDPSQYETEPHALFPGHLMLAHKKNGDCIYLDRKKGCTIHGRQPKICREMDCRGIAKLIKSKKKARSLSKSGVLNIDVWKRGRELSAKLNTTSPNSQNEATPIN